MEKEIHVQTRDGIEIFTRTQFLVGFYFINFTVFVIGFVIGYMYANPT